VSRTYKLTVGTRFPVVLDIEDCRDVGTEGNGACIRVEVRDLTASPNPLDQDDDPFTLIELSPEQARQLIAIIRRTLGEISETQLAELVDDDA